MIDAFVAFFAGVVATWVATLPNLSVNAIGLPVPKVLRVMNEVVRLLVSFRVAETLLVGCFLHPTEFWYELAGVVLGFASCKRFHSWLRNRMRLRHIASGASK